MGDGESGKKTLVIYSLGNFISTQLKAVNMVGNIVTFDIVKEENMPAYLTNIVSNPTVTHYVADETVHDSQDLPVRSGVEVYLMEDYTQALCSAARRAALRKLYSRYAEKIYHRRYPRRVSARVSENVEIACRVKLFVNIFTTLLKSAEL